MLSILKTEILCYNCNCNKCVGERVILVKEREDEHKRKRLLRDGAEQSVNNQPHNHFVTLSFALRVCIS